MTTLANIFGEFQKEKQEAVADVLDQLAKVREELKELVEITRTKQGVHHRWEKVGKLELQIEIIGHYRDLVVKGLLYPDVAQNLIEALRSAYEI